MRLKQIWGHCDLPAKANLVWSRITFSRLTIAYFSLAVIHCIVQIIFQVEAFTINASAANTLWSHLQSAHMTQEANGFAILGDDLRICYSVPDTITTDSCNVIWSPAAQASPSYGLAAASLAASATPVASSPSSSVAAITSAPAATSTASASSVSTSNSIATTAPPTTALVASPSPSSSPSKTTIVISPSSNAGQATTLVIDANADSDDEDEDDDEDFEHTHIVNRDVNDLSDTCVKALIWPVQRLNDTKREDITFIMFQIWVLGMSIVALLNESIPHTAAALVTHLLATVWAVYQIFQTDGFRKDFARLITNGACKENLLGSYWVMRRDAEIASAALNGVVFVASVFLSFKLTKIYGWQTFKRVGASLTINRIYKLVLLLSISIQLGLFFIVSAMALWIDQLMNGSIAHLAILATVYRGVFIGVFCLLIPWLSLGWFSVRLEKRKLALVFLAISFVFIGLWAAMFKSSTFRWTYVKWTFFAVMATTSGFLMISTFLLGLACRLNFGKGLPRYLNAEEPLEGDDFTPVFYEKEQYDEDPEKVEFPSNGRPVPTFSATFGRGLEVPKPTQMRFGPSRGPGMDMYNNSQAAQQEFYQQHAVGRSISSSSTHSGRSQASLARTDTRGSDMTHQSGSSSSSHMGKRWVIE